MIKLYFEKDFDKNIIKEIINDEEIWSFPIEELEYLFQEHKNKSFILIDDRLYEFEGVE